MPTFKDLWIWQEAHASMLEIHDFAKSLPQDERFRKRDQIERSSSSVSDNIASAYSSYYYNDKIKELCIARKEAGETQNHIEALFGKKLLSPEKANIWFQQYEKVMAGINSYINYIRQKQNATQKKGRGKRP